MSSVHLLFAHGSPVAAYQSESDAIRAAFALPSCLDVHLCIVRVPCNPDLVASGELVAAVPAGERRSSGAAGAGPVTLSSNGNKNP